jgi:hypothetical protein
MIVVARVNFMVAETEACRGDWCFWIVTTCERVAERTCAFPVENERTWLADLKERKAKSV